MAVSSLLPEEFQFSPSALQDFVDCPARFYLRHIRRLRYPAPESAPLRDFEARAELGARFHRLIQQAGLGIPDAALAATLVDPTLAGWWASFRAHVPQLELPPQRHWEITLSAPLAERRLVARCDLIALAPDRAVIVDWKTAARRPERASLERRLQTIVYPYLLAQAGAHLNGGSPIPPERIRLIYWFAEFPQQPEIFVYSAAQYERDAAYLTALAADIRARTDEAAFALTDDLDRCRYCSYRSLHDRGAQAGSFPPDMPDDEDDWPRPVEPEQAAESAF